MLKWQGACTWPASASVLGAVPEIPLLQTDHGSLPYLPACSSSVLLPAGLVARLLAGSASPSAPLWPAPLAAASSVSTPGCEQTGEVREEQCKLLLGRGQWKGGRRSSVQKVSPLPADKAGALEAWYCMQGTRVTTTLPYLVKEMGIRCVSVSCTSHPGTPDVSLHLWFLLQKIPPTTTICLSLSDGLALWLKTKAGLYTSVFLGSVSPFRDKRPCVLPRR